MTEYRIEREVVVEAPVDVVWRTVTEPDQITQWFADRVDLEATPGGRGTFVFDHPGGASNTYPLVVERVEAPSLFTFRWGPSEGEEPSPGNSLLVEFRLDEDGHDRTRLRVVETGLERLGWADDDMRRYAEEHVDGWTTHLDRLVHLLADGVVDPPRG
jgi:uncharacterized protein YndB with AHSA1/START domain